MTSDILSKPKTRSRLAVLTLSVEAGAPQTPRRLVLDGLSKSLLVVAGMFLIALIAMLDYATDSHLSFSVLYLIPVAACAWCVGPSHGFLLSLAGSIAWHEVELIENPALPPSVRLWNGVVRFGILALASSLVSRLRAGLLRERLLARTDALTGAANGRTFYETAEAEVERARRNCRPLTLAYFDLDDFKRLNDRLGHAVGDSALLAVVQTIQLHLRATDLLARLGGDEFALLLPETGPEGAEALLSRIREHLAKVMTSKGWTVTLSVGAATFLRPPQDMVRLVQRVDGLMYTAKRKGKGRVEHAIFCDPIDAEDEEKKGIERRAAPRIPCHRPARIRREGQDGFQEEFATVRDVSAVGIGLQLDKRLLEDTLVLVEPLSIGPKTLLARVLYVTAEEGGWRHGCELTTRLSVEELNRWPE